MYNLEGRVAVVTGGARGIGRAICLRLAREGADIAVVDVDEAGAQAVVAEINALGRQAVALKVDVTNADQVEWMIAETVANLGSVDIMVNNAGIQYIANLLDTEEKQWDRMMDVNLKSMWLCGRAAALQMIRQGRGGRIVNACSRAGKVASMLPFGAYVVTKHAVVGLTRQFALDLAQHRILVNAYCPGVVDTPMWDLIDRQVAEKRGVPLGSVKKSAVDAIPLGRIEQPEDVARLVAFLSSDECEYMTGQCINVTGGSVMH